jgi:hypothetical protein
VLALLPFPDSVRPVADLKGEVFDHVPSQHVLVYEWTIGTVKSLRTYDP